MIFISKPVKTIFILNFSCWEYLEMVGTIMKNKFPFCFIFYSTWKYATSKTLKNVHIHIKLSDYSSFFHNYLRLKKY